MNRRNLSRLNQKVTSFEDLRGLRAEGYVRDSTLDQRDGFGPTIQKTNEQRFAEAYGLVLGDRWYMEFVSGRNMEKRKEFQQVLEDAALDRFDVLLVDHTSRFGRNQAECIRYKAELDRLGKTVVFVSQGILSGSDRDFLSERINETLDEQYSRNLSRYICSGLAAKAADGYAIGRAPLGYRQEKHDSGRGAWMIPDNKTMPTLVHLLTDYATGIHSFRTLAGTLNAEGYLTTNNRPFTESSISTVLNNRFYSGKTVYHRGRPDESVVEGAHDVPEEVRELWAKCQEVRFEKRQPGQPGPPQKQQRVYPLTGVLICDGCGEPFHGITHHSNKLKTRRMSHGWHRCSMRPRSIDARKIESEFAERVLGHIILDDSWRDAVLTALAKEGPEPDHRLDIRRIERAISKLRKQHMWGAISDEKFKTEHQLLRRQLRTLTPPASPKMTPNLDRAAELLRDLPALWQHPGVSPEQRRDMAHEIFQEIRLREGSLVAVKPKPNYAPLFAYSLVRQSSVGGTRLS